MKAPRVALLCSGLGNVLRGHEAFARSLFDLLRDDLDIALFKGAGAAQSKEIVVPHIPRSSTLLSGMHLAVSPKWLAGATEVECLRIEGESFAWGALPQLLAGNFDVIHCLEQEVCNTLYDVRHLFSKTPKFLWSNGGAIPAKRQPRCDFVQEHTDFNLARSNRDKAFVIPHGVDVSLFHPGVASDFRKQHGIPDDAFVVISVGTICYWHKRMDYVIREVAAVPDIWLVIVGQVCPDTAAIKALGKELMGDRIVFTSLPRDKLPEAYAAADIFVLGSLFETFGIVYIEAMAMGLPVICTNHPNQRSIVQQGIFIDMSREGALSEALRNLDKTRLNELAEAGREIVGRCYEQNLLRGMYIEHYRRIAATQVALPSYTLKRRIETNIKNIFRI